MEQIDSAASLSEEDEEKEPTIMSYEEQVRKALQKEQQRRE